MHVIGFNLHGQCFEFNYKIDNVFFVLSECFNLLFSICCFAFVTECYLYFSDKLVSVLEIFFCTYIPVMLLLSQVNTAVILSLVAVILLLLRNNQIFLHQSSNFILSPSNYLRSGTILLDITAYSIVLYTIGTGVVKISSISSITGSIVLFSSEVYSLVILNDPSTSDSISILS